MYLKTTRAIALVALSLVVLVSLSMTNAPAHAQGASKPRPSPDLPPIWCLGATQNAKVTGTNTWSQYGNVTNNCGTTVHSAFVEVSASVSCSGYEPNSNPSDTIVLPDPWNNGVTRGYNFGAVARCEVCQNGQPVAFPPMNLVLEMLVAGDSGAPNYQEYDGVPNNQNIPITLNNSPAYAFPCP